MPRYADAATADDIAAVTPPAAMLIVAMRADMLRTMPLMPCCRAMRFLRVNR